MSSLIGSSKEQKNWISKVAKMSIRNESTFYNFSFLVFLEFTSDQFFKFKDLLMDSLEVRIIWRFHLGSLIIQVIFDGGR
jgi:hypothetical protein